MTFLVVGSTGTMGSQVTAALLEAGQTVHALVRDRASPRALQLRAAGARLQLGDLKNARDVEAAVRGVACVIITATATLSHKEGDTLEAVDDRGVQTLLTACVRNGVRRVVLVSFSRSIGDDFPLARFKRAAERRLESSSLAYSILLPSYFPEKFLTPLVGFDVKQRRVRIFGDGMRPISYIATADVSLAAAKCGLSLAGNAVLSMGGPRAISQLEAVDLAERITGDKMMLEYMSLDEIESTMSRTTDPLKQSYLGLYRGCARGDVAAVEWASTLGITPTPLDAWANETWRSSAN